MNGVVLATVCSDAHLRYEFLWRIILLVTLVVGGCVYALIRRWRPLRGIDIDRADDEATP